MTQTHQQTDKDTWNVTSICPMDIQFGFPLGTQQNNPKSLLTLKRMNEFDESIHVDVTESLRVSDVFKGSEYVSITDDVSTMRLFRWHAKIEDKLNREYDVTLHVFPNHIAVAEIKLDHVPAENASELDSTALKQSELVLGKAQIVFNELMHKLAIELKNTHAIFDAKESAEKIYWPSRAIRLSKEQRAKSSTEAFLTEWLKDTHRPEDAAKIASSEKNESITWLKYVIVEPELAYKEVNDNLDNSSDEQSTENPIGKDVTQEVTGTANHQATDYRIETLILAQYCYSAQEKCNRKLRQAIEWAFQGENKKLDTEIQRAKRALETSRVQVKLHQVSVNECLRHLTRRKSHLVEDIFDCWDYSRLVDNGNAMLDLCADKISDSNSRQAKISASKTEYILIGISLFTVLDFVFFITQFSREAMANPTLDHNDGGPSGLLTMIADVPADTMFFAAVVIVGLIFLAYKKVKG